MLKEVQISDIPSRKKWIEELNEFYKSGIDAAELLYDPAQSTGSVVMSVRYAVKRQNIPVAVLRRKDKIFLVRRCANA